MDRYKLHKFTDWKKEGKYSYENKCIRYSFELADFSQGIGIEVYFSDYGEFHDQIGAYNHGFIYVDDDQADMPAIFKAISEKYGYLILNRIPDEDKTYEMCYKSILQKGTILSAVPDRFKTPELIGIAVRNDGLALRSVPKEKRTEELCKLALETSALALEYVPSKYITSEMCLTAFNKNYKVIKHIPDEFKTIDMCITAVLKDVKLIKYVPNIYLVEVFRKAFEENKDFEIPYRFLDQDLEYPTYTRYINVRRKEENLPYQNNDKEAFWFNLQKRVKTLKEKEKLISESNTKVAQAKSDQEKLETSIKVNKQIVDLQFQVIEDLEIELQELLQKLADVRKRIEEVKSNATTISLNEIGDNQNERRI